MEAIKTKTIPISLIFLLFSVLTFGQNYDKAIKAFENSYALEKEGEYSKAIDELKNVFDEDSYEINLRLGWLYYSNGMFGESSTYYRKCIHLMPYSVEAKFGLALPLYSMGEWKQVIELYFDILRIDPGNYTANYRLGSIYYGREDYTNAFKYFEKIANMYPFDHDALLMFAWTHFRLGKLREAEVLFNKVLMNKPDDESAAEGLELIP